MLAVIAAMMQQRELASAARLPRLHVLTLAVLQPPVTQVTAAEPPLVGHRNIHYRTLRLFTSN